MVFLCSVSSVRMRGDSLFCWLALILIHWTQQKRPWHMMWEIQVLALGRNKLNESAIYN
jgi:hypothetical protein